MSAPRLFVITGCAPGCHSVEGIMLRDILMWYPAESLHVAVLGPTHGTERNLECVPQIAKSVYPFHPVAVPHGRGSLIARASRRLRYLYAMHRDEVTVLPQLVEAARQWRPDRIVSVLDHRRAFHLLPKLYQRVDARVSSIVLDPPEWIIAQGRPDRWTAKRMLAGFYDCLSASETAAFVSEPMRVHYGGGVHRTLVLQHGYDGQYWRPVRWCRTDSRRVTVAIAGKLYCLDAWEAFVAALDKCHWSIDGSDVWIRIIGGALPSSVAARARYEIIGWCSQRETIELLAGSDVAYLPYWFDPAFEHVTRFSFPGKLSAYAAAARPVLFHGPSWSAAASYVTSRDIGAVCSSRSPDVILATLGSLLEARAYQQFAENMERVRRTELSADVMRARFADLIGDDGSGYRRPQSPRCPCGLDGDAPKDPGPDGWCDEPR